MACHGEAFDRDGCEQNIFVQKQSFELMAKIQTVLQRFPGHKPVRIRMGMPEGFRVDMRLGEELRVNPSEELILALERLPGVVNALRR